MDVGRMPGEMKMKALTCFLAAIPLLFTSVGSASLPERCEFEASVTRTGRLPTLNGQNSFVPGKTNTFTEFVTLEILSAKVLDGTGSPASDCAWHQGRSYDLVRDQQENFEIGQRLRIEYSHVTGVTPDGVAERVSIKVVGSEPARP